MRRVFFVAGLMWLELYPSLRWLFGFSDVSFSKAELLVVVGCIFVVVLFLFLYFSSIVSVFLSQFKNW